MANDPVNVNIEGGTATMESTGVTAPVVASVADGVCSVYVLAANGKPIANMQIIDKENGTVVPVNVATCTEAVVCSQGMTMDHHLQALYGHSNDAEAHLTAGEKFNLETKEGAQAKANAAKDGAVAAASLLIATAKTEAATDATQKAEAARKAANNYTDKVTAALDNHKADNGNPHGVTAEQVGLGNVPNKSTNNQEPTYTEAETLAPLKSGEKLSIAFGKIAKAISSFISHKGDKANPHGVTASQAGALPTTGGTMTGNLTMNGGDIILKEGVNYGTELPEPGVKGRIFFKVVE